MAVRTATPNDRGHAGNRLPRLNVATMTRGPRDRRPGVIHATWRFCRSGSILFQRATAWRVWRAALPKAGARFRWDA